MHELSVAQSILKIAGARAEEAGARKITRIALDIGELTCINSDNLTFVFDVLKKDTLASDSELVIRRIPLEAKCESCNRTFAVVEYRFSCDTCGSKKVNIVQGNETNLVSLEVE